MSLKDQIRKRTEEHQKENTSTAGKFLPVHFDGELYKPDEGTNNVDILPYIVGNNHPTLKAGDVDFSLSYWVHYNVGPGEKVFVCPKKTYGQRCPLCDMVKAQQDDGAIWDDVKALAPKRRTLYNVIPVNQNGPTDCKLFDVSFHLFEKILSKDCTVDGEVVYFAEIDEDGRTVKFKARKTRANGREFLSYDSFMFEKRKYTYPEDILKKSICLDDILIKSTAEEIQAALEGDELFEDEEDVEPAAVERKPKAESFSDQAIEQHESGVVVCPTGHVYGTDNDQFPECETCKVWKECFKSIQ